MSWLKTIIPFKRPSFKQCIIYASTASVATTSIGIGTYWLKTREQTFHELNTTHDPLVQSRFHQTFNPHKNESLSDIYEARIPLSQIRPDLIADFNRGGTKLIERYGSGVLGGWGFAIQRRISIKKAKRLAHIDPDELYTQAQILDSSLEKGTGISNHFTVLERTPKSILFRGGSPSDENDLKILDSLMQGVVEIDMESKTAIFQLKCMFYNGQIKGSQPPLPEAMVPLHLIYAKALAANGVANCKN